MNRPEKSEYAEFYANYIALVPESDIVFALQNQLTEIEILFAEMSDAKADHAYDTGKWTVKELLGHIIDGERVFSYRALRISRNDQTPLPGFEENFYVENSNFKNRTIADLIEEFLHLRQSNVLMFKNLSEESWTHRGTASNREISVRALAFTMVGHVRHHINILKERYLV
jgi:hypothetical protein